MNEEEENRKWWKMNKLLSWSFTWGEPDPEAHARHQALEADRADEAKMEEAFKQAHPQLF